MRDKILKWLLTGRVGCSSKAMAACLVGVDGRNDHPHDPDDFNRCLLFLKVVPEARGHFDDLKKISKEWSNLIDRWDEIETCFLNESGIDGCKNPRSTLTYKLMKDVISGN